MKKVISISDTKKLGMAIMLILLLQGIFALKEAILLAWEDIQEYLILLLLML